MPMPAMNHPFRIALLLLSFWAFSPAQASVVLSGTRVIFPGNEKEATVKLTNEADTPTLIQAWLDKGEHEESPGHIEVPFVMLPTIFRMEPGKGQSLRIIHSGEPLPTQKESLFWLNVLEVPSKPKGQEEAANNLQFAFRTRIKLIYRPAGLQGSALEAPTRLQWSLDTNADRQPVLKASNPTPYVVNLSGIHLKSGSGTLDAGVGHVPPGETATFALEQAEGAIVGAAATVQYSSVNDWGGMQSHESALAK